MTNPFFQMGAVFAALVMFSFVALEGENVGQTLGLIEQDEPVLVFSIPHPDQFAKVRAAVSPDRILWEDEDGMALAGQRIYVTDVTHAGAIIKQAGWIDQPIQIVGLGSVDEDDDAESEDGSATPMDREARVKRLRGLVNKPTLTRGEQMFVLSAMNEGIEI